MLTLYVAALIFGLGMVAVQLLSSSEAHQPGSPALPGELGAPGTGDELVLDSAGGHAEPGWASVLTSLRFYTFAAVAFGAVGAPVTVFGSTGAGLTFMVALVTGLGLGALATLGFRLLGREALSSSASSTEMRGHVGRVLVACAQGKPGKVRLTVRGQIVDLVATTDEPRLEPGSGVIVQEVHADRVHVCAAPSELLPG